MNLFKICLNPFYLINTFFTLGIGGPIGTIFTAITAANTVKKIAEGQNPIEAILPSVVSNFLPGADKLTGVSEGAQVANAVKSIDPALALQQVQQQALQVPQNLGGMQAIQAAPVDSAMGLFNANMAQSGIPSMLGGMQSGQITPPGGYVGGMDISQVASTPQWTGEAPAQEGISALVDNRPTVTDSVQQNVAESATGTSGGTGGDTGGGLWDSIKESWSKLPEEKKWLYGGIGGIGALSLAQELMRKKPKQNRPKASFNYNPSLFRPSLPFAEGGIASVPQSGGLQNRYVSGMGPLDQGIQNIPNPREVMSSNYGYLNPSVQMMARGGVADLGGYSDGGRLLKGPGDGMSDNIPASISGKQPARLADGEFVVPADVVSHLGNGSTDAGAKHLYAMMARVRKARTGRKSQGKQINSKKVMGV